jgi:ABC-type nitrate/sulfonate/bicarbonate transport system permease component
MVTVARRDGPGHLTALYAVVRALVYYAPVALLLLAWDIASRAGWLSAELLPSPEATYAAFRSVFDSGELAQQTLISLKRELAGLLLSVVLGTIVGITMARIELARLLLRPVITFLYPMPKSALIPVLLLWFGLGDMSKIAAVFLGCLLPVVISSYNGARGVDPLLVWSARSLGAGQLGVLWKIILPAALPEILSGIRMALALSWLLLVSAELLLAEKGLGYMIGYYGESGDYATMFSAIIVVILIGSASDRVFLRVMAWSLRWRTLSS